jgi:cysteine-rich repeat protein
VCNPNNVDTHYKGIYCGIRGYNNEEADEEIVETLSEQFGMDEELIEEILANTLCETILREYDEDEKADLPKAVQDACLPTGRTIDQAFGGWTIFTDIRNAYKKEKAMQMSAKSLEFKFKASEQYWDGQIGPGPDAPFDLIVDLNLIEIVLFGSQAQWMNDVFSFPTEEDEEEGPEEVPADELLPGEEEEEEGEVPEDEGDPGVKVAEEEEEELPPGCVSPDDPDADPTQNPLCGNGLLDVLMGEECDDGNKESGDGCNQYCQIEAAGANDQCIDPEAVTFREAEDGDETECPPGSVPSKVPALIGEEAGPPKEVPQSPEYPGPFLGGTLKQFPASNRPPCGPGESTVDITVAGETHAAEDDDGNPLCIPTEFCADPDIARTFLAALPPLSILEGDWKALPDDDIRKEWVESIEALFCVNLIEHNRPQAPYQLIEGCIDCHITAMVDALEKALETNVTPLQNTTSAFGISSRYGPSFSFNLDTAAKAKIKYQSSTTTRDAIKKANENEDKAQKQNNPAPLTIPTNEGSLEKLVTDRVRLEESRENILEDTRTFKMSNDAISDQEVGGRVIPLLNQMRDSFGNIQSRYEGLVGTTELDKKKQCEQ